MTEITDVETAVDLIGKTSTEIQSNSRLKIGKIRPEDNIDLLFVVSDAGTRIPMRQLMLCPANQKVCKRERCLGWEVDHCRIYESHKSDRKSTNEKSKEAHLLNDFVDAYIKEEE